jgi:aldehyde:ferredoxin oxidoreductase
MYEEVNPEVTPLDPQNVLVFSAGPFTGTMVPGSGRTEVASKSPATGIQGMSNMGGYWGPQLKYAGYDSLIIVGKAPKPVYLAIDNDEVEIRDASHLWGRDTYETPIAIRKELNDPDTEVACIGRGGENQVVYATIQNRLGNAAGRTGMGAVMGSKSLKAIAVRGTKGVSIAEPERFLELCMEAFEVQKPFLANPETVQAVGNDPPSWALVLGNYEATEWEEQKSLRGGHEPFWKEHKNRLGDGKIGCFNCQIRCSNYYDLPQLGTLVASCNVYTSTMWVLKDPDFASWYAFSTACQREGIDAMSVSRMLAWAMDLYENGKITRKDTDGISLNWGNAKAIHQLMEKICRREGFGDILASTVREARDKIGRGVEEPMHIKGLPLGGTNLVNWRPRGLGAAVNPRGGDEYRTRYGSFDYLGGKGSGMTAMSSPDSWEAKTAMSLVEKALAEKGARNDKTAITQFDYEARGNLAALAHKMVAVSDMLGQCRWNTIFLNAGISIEFQANAMSAGEGRETTIEDLLEAGSRVAAQEKAFAAREGLTRADDTLPKKLFDLQMPGTWPKDKTDPTEFEKMKDEYYEAMGWDVKTGIPRFETLEALGLSDVVIDLEKLGKLSRASTSDPGEAAVARAERKTRA